MTFTDVTNWIVQQSGAVQALLISSPLIVTGMSVLNYLEKRKVRKESKETANAQAKILAYLEKEAVEKLELSATLKSIKEGVSATAGVVSLGFMDSKGITATTKMEMSKIISSTTDLLDIEDAKQAIQEKALGAFKDTTTQLEALAETASQKATNISSKAIEIYKELVGK